MDNQRINICNPEFRDILPNVFIYLNRTSLKSILLVCKYMNFIFFNIFINHKIHIELNISRYFGKNEFHEIRHINDINNIFKLNIYKNKKIRKFKLYAYYDKYVDRYYIYIKQNWHNIYKGYDNPYYALDDAINTCIKLFDKN